MFIIKFNNMIRNKWIWGAFAVIVMLAFAAGDIMSSSARGAERNSFGKIGDREISYEDFNAVRQMIRLQSRNSQRAFDEVDEEQVWERLAEVVKAEEMGLVVSEDEVNSAILETPDFRNSEGKFDEDMYLSILDRFLRTTPREYARMVKYMLLLSKFEPAIASASWVAPSLVDEQARGMSDEFTFRYVQITNSFAGAEVEVSEEELDETFRENKAEYRIPELATVRYVAFPAASYAKDIAIEDEEAENYYDNNMSRFQATKDGVTETLPLEDVRSIIDSELRLVKGADKAADAAAEFADLFYYDQQREGLGDTPFEKAAADRGYIVVTSAPFSATASSISGVGYDAVAEFREAAFALREYVAGSKDSSPKDAYSDAVAAKNGAYVLAYGSRSDARDPALDEIRDRVEADAVERARSRMYVEHIDKVRGEIENAAKGEESFDDAVAKFQLVPSTNITSNFSGISANVPGGMAVAMKMTRMNAGEMSSVISTDDDSVVIVEVLDRKSENDSDAAMFSESLVRYMAAANAERAIADWRADNLKNARIDSPHRRAALAARVDKAAAEDEEE